jgi:hypothetical protein
MTLTTLPMIRILHRFALPSLALPSLSINPLMLCNYDMDLVRGF